MILGFINVGIFLARSLFFILLANYNPFRHINCVRCHGGMATCQVSFDVQNPRGGSAPRNRTFTGHVFLFTHGHCLLQCDCTRARAADFLAHGTHRAHACTATTETTRFGLTTHPRVHYHLSLLQVHCHMIAHCCQSNGHSTKQRKFCCFCGCLLCSPCVLGGPQKRRQIRSGCLTPAFSGAQKKRRQNQKWLPHPLPSRGPKRGQNCYVTPAFSGVPTRGDKIRIGYLTHAFSEAHIPKPRGVKCCGL